MELKKAGIIGTGMCVPDSKLTNEDFERIVDTSDEWITTRTGIKERRKVSDGQACSDLATEAAKEALDSAGLKPTDIDMIVLGTVTGDHAFPATSCLVQNNLGATNSGAFDIGAACNGFIASLSVASKFIQTGEARNVLVIGAETLTKFVNYKDRASCILFGDGAGAAVISNTFQGKEILTAELGADGSGASYMILPAGGSRQPPTVESVSGDGHYIIVKGREVYKFAVHQMVSLVRKAIEMNPGVDFGIVIPHQVNLRIIESAREKLGLEAQQIAVNIHKYGNTSAASAPIMMHEAIQSGMMNGMEGKLVVLCAFGAGLNWGYVAIKW
ncbi:MAG: beta-ketoacyl-ACP synthase III [Planctomycetota bacterium]|jgi:3-oxoacyl-[acyl-carrier-protein] synthase-3